LESDAWLSGDGEVVLVHDATVGRGLRKVKVRDHTAARLGDFGVPRLADLYRELGTDYELSIDVKHPEVLQPLLEVAAAHDATSRLWVCHGSIETLAAARSTTAANLVHSRRKDRIELPLERHALVLAQSGIAAVNFHHTDWSAGLVALYHRFDVKAFAWDVQEERHIAAMVKFGIDALYCDRPDRLITTVNRTR
jgi:glycerophosphoryl diester phosphodiesterase